MNDKTTEKGAAQSARQRPVSEICRWSEALETVISANIRFAFAWQRTILRAMAG